MRALPRYLLAFVLGLALTGCDDEPVTNDVELSPDQELIDVDGEDGDAETTDLPNDLIELEEVPSELDLLPDELDDEPDLQPDELDEPEDVSDQSDIPAWELTLPTELAEFYAGLESLDEEQFHITLLDFIDDQTPLGYELARDHIYGVNGGIGIDLHDGLFECIYSGRTIEPDGTTYPRGTCTTLDGEEVQCNFNTEHTWPSSALVPADEPTGRGDLHHIFPCWSVANNRRSNFDYGEPLCTPPNCDWQEGGSFLGKNNATAWVFHVRLARRGDAARAQFYMSLRYGMPILEPVESILRVWHEDDPVDEAEFERNNAIDSVQGNRNPFVDRPDFIGLISDF